MKLALIHPAILFPLYFCAQGVWLVIHNIAFQTKQFHGGYPADGDSIGILAFASLLFSLFAIGYFSVFHSCNLTQRRQATLTRTAAFRRSALFAGPPMLFSAVLMNDLRFPDFFLCGVSEIFFLAAWFGLGMLSYRHQAGAEIVSRTSPRAHRGPTRARGQVAKHGPRNHPPDSPLVAGSTVHDAPVPPADQPAATRPEAPASPTG